MKNDTRQEEPKEKPFKVKDVWTTLKETFNRFTNNEPMIYAAAIAFYTIFSLPAMILIIIKVAGVMFGEEAVSGQLYHQIDDMIGPESAKTTQKIVQNSLETDSGWISTVISIGTLIFSATTVFVTLQTSLNKVWEVKPNPNAGIKKLVIDRLLSFAMVSSLGFILAVSLLLEAIISVLTDWINNSMEGISTVLVYGIEKGLSIVILTVVFALLFKMLPDAKVKWRDTWFGAFTTTILFIIGKFLIGYYIGNSDMGSTYGAAGSFVVILIWVYYSSVIVLFGAECTQTYARLFGHKIKPSSFAVKVKKKEEVVEVGVDDGDDF